MDWAARLQYLNEPVLNLLAFEMFCKLIVLPPPRWKVLLNLSWRTSALGILDEIASWHYSAALLVLPSKSQNECKLTGSRTCRCASFSMPCFPEMMGNHWDVSDKDLIIVSFKKIHLQIELLQHFSLRNFIISVICNSINGNENCSEWNLELLYCLFLQVTACLKLSKYVYKIWYHLYCIHQVLKKMLHS